MIRQLLSNLDAGLYKAAHEVKDADGVNRPRSSFGFITDQLKSAGLEPTPEQLQTRVDRLLQQAHVGDRTKLSAYAMSKFEQVAHDTWGLDMLLGELGIRTKGAGSDIVEKFYGTGTSATLFPAYMESQITVGKLANPLLNDLVATETAINSHTHQGAILNDAQFDRQLIATGEGADLPITDFAVADTAVNLRKFGRYFEVSYEALRLQPLDVVSIWLQRIGQQIGIDETNDAIDCLRLGDGNAGSAITAANDWNVAAPPALTYADLVTLFMAFIDGYKMSTVITRMANMTTVLNMAEFKDPLAGFSFQSNGVLPGPFGAKWYRWDNLQAVGLLNSLVIAVDQRYALEKLTEGGTVVDSDNIIRRQVRGTSISNWVGWHKLDYNAVEILDVAAEL
jgi:hypothetical protein